MFTMDQETRKMSVRDLLGDDAARLPEPGLPEPGLPVTEEDLRLLAEDIVRHCPSLTHLLLALARPDAAGSNPLAGMN